MVSDGERATAAMREHPLFTGMPDDGLADLVARGRVRAFRARSYVTMQGDPADDVYLLLEGRLEVTATALEHAPQLRTVLEPVRLFGELGVLAGAARSASVLCLDDARVWIVDRDGFVSTIESQPTVASRLLATLAREVLEKEALAQDLVWLDLRGRLAKRLLHLATTDDDGQVVGPITQSDLASLCGASRESVSKAIASFERRQLIRREGRAYRLVDVAALERLAGG